MTAYVHGQNTAEFGSGVAVDVKGRRRVEGLAKGPFLWDCSPLSLCFQRERLSLGYRDSSLLPLMVAWM